MAMRSKGGGGHRSPHTSFPPPAHIVLLPQPRRRCRRAGASAFSSPNPLKIYCMLQSMTQTDTSSSSNKQARFSRHTSAFFDALGTPCTDNRRAHELRQYAARMSFYKLKQFQCEVTGKSGLDYFQALESEQNEARELHQRFPEPLKYMVLRSVQWRACGFISYFIPNVEYRNYRGYG